MVKRVLPAQVEATRPRLLRDRPAREVLETVAPRNKSRCSPARAPQSVPDVGIARRHVEDVESPSVPPEKCRELPGIGELVLRAECWRPGYAWS